MITWWVPCPLLPSLRSAAPLSFWVRAISSPALGSWILLQPRPRPCLHAHPAAWGRARSRATTVTWCGLDLRLHHRDLRLQESHHRVIVGREWYEPYGLPPEAVVEAALGVLLAQKQARSTDGLITNSQFPVNYFAIIELSQWWVGGWGQRRPAHGGAGRFVGAHCARTHPWGACMPRHAALLLRPPPASVCLCMQWTRWQQARACCCSGLPVPAWAAAAQVLGRVGRGHGGGGWAPGGRPRRLALRPHLAVHAHHRAGRRQWRHRA